MFDALARCVRLAAGVAPGPPNTRYRPAGWALTGQDFHLLGYIIEFQEVVLHRNHSIDPGFSWRRVKYRPASPLLPRRGWARATGRTPTGRYPSLVRIRRR
jgi:hypothetical protein